MRAYKRPSIEPIKKMIMTAFPEAKLVVLDNPRDNAGSVIYVNDAPPEFAVKMSPAIEYVVIPISETSGSECLVVPIEPEDADTTGIRTFHDTRS